MTMTIPTKRSNARVLFKFEPFSKKQRMVLNWWTDASGVSGYDGIIADGAIRSGKTICMSLSFVMWAMETFEEENFGMCGKTIASFRRNVLNPLKKMLRSRGYQFKEHRADNLLVVSRGDRTNYFYIFGGKDESSQELVQGITLAGVFFDEVALMPETFVNQATARCSVDGSKFWFNCNPEGPNHWFYRDWIQRKEQRQVLYLHFVMDDNYSLSDQIKERYRNQYSGVFYDRFIRGRWVIAEGVVYDMFDRDKHVVSMSSLEKKLTPTCYVSCDYGTQNATVFKMWTKGADGIWYCTKEYYYSGRDQKKQKTDAEYADDMKEFIGNAMPRAVIVDPSAASFIAALRQEGLPVIQARNSVLDGIREMAKLLTLGQIKYVDTCTHTFEEFGSYAWDPKAAARGEDAPIKDNDHCMDADRYFINTILGRKAIISDKRKKGLR